MHFMHLVNENYAIIIFNISEIKYYYIPKEYSILHKIYFRYVVRRVAITARRIITASKNSKHDIINILKIPSEKIAVTYYAADENSDGAMKIKLKELEIICVLTIGSSCM